MSKDKNTNQCEECKSLYYAATSNMSSLCQECAHHLYGYKNCIHKMEHGRCLNCYWDGSISEYLKSKLLE